MKIKILFSAALLSTLYSLLSLSAHAESGNFDLDRWYGILNDIQAKAIEQGISNHTINEVIQPSVFIPSIIKKDRNQSEFKLNLSEYLKRTVNADRIAQGRKMRVKYPTLLGKTETKYGVPRNVILAFWGMESNFGNFKAQYKLSDAFLTLIYDGRRETFFTKQLFALMKIADKSRLEIGGIGGSWAGAMGHFQFIPTTLEQYGADGNGDGKIDIINNISDAMFSAGNYLNKLGWATNEKIVAAVHLPADFDASLCEGKTKKTLAEWAADGIDVPAGDETVGIVCDASAISHQPSADSQTDYGLTAVGYLTYPNFYRIKKWNNSNWYAVAIALLSEGLRTKD
ncbi:MAG: lytic murein transglycosylase [Rickettsiales bacterium]|jgi:lytic murein transglycosylase|nr:lytic murein transglycosylase [Rickettsiales bacterium]